MIEEKKNILRDPTWFPNWRSLNLTPQKGHFESPGSWWMVEEIRRSPVEVKTTQVVQDFFHKQLVNPATLRENPAKSETFSGLHVKSH